MWGCTRAENRTCEAEIEGDELVQRRVAGTRVLDCR